MTTPPVDPVDQVDPTELDDLAAELDDGTTDPRDDDEQAEPVEPAELHSGICEGGPPPYPGKLLVSRFPAGVLLIDRSAGRAWVYDLDAAGGLYRCRNDTGAPVDVQRRLHAADSDTYEVRAYDSEFDGDDLDDEPSGGA